MNALFNHLWQSSLFAGTVALGALALRSNSPRTRYWLWLAASVKFLIPFSLLVWAGSRVQLPLGSPSIHVATAEKISNYFAPVTMQPLPTTGAPFPWPVVVGAIWLFGISLLIIRWFRRWRAIRSVAKQGAELPLRFPIPVLSSRSGIEPGVFGIFRPVLLLPQGLTDHLTSEQLDAVLAHESHHVRCRDNLTAAVHMFVETLFWFHPLVWWIGAKLMDERERDCDEAVLRQGSERRDYAQGIVNVCRTYIESPLSCVAGISGSDLKKRIRGIMTWRASLPVTIRGKVILSVAAIGIVSVPFVIGVVRAQSLSQIDLSTTVAFEVATVKPSPAGEPARGRTTPERFTATNTSVLRLLQTAFDIQEERILNAPSWARTDGYDIAAKAPEGVPLGPNLASMLRALLKDRFGMTTHVEMRDMPIYELVLSRRDRKLGPNLQQSGCDCREKGAARCPEGPPLKGIPKLEGSHATCALLQFKGRYIMRGYPMANLGKMLTGPAGRVIVDRSGLSGTWNVELEFTPDQDLANDPSTPAGPSLPTAVEEQLGLKLQSAHGQVEVLVVDHLERPTDN